MVTLSDVAKKAGVGLSTASYVINKTGLNKVSPKTQERILAAAKELKYFPSIAGRALAKGRTYTAGALFPDITGSFMAEMLQGLEDALDESEYSLFLCSYGSAEEFKQKCVVLREKPTDGTIILPIMGEFDDFYKLAETKPLVTVAKSGGVSGLPGVWVDGTEIYRLAVEYLLGHGHHSIAIQHPYDQHRLEDIAKKQKAHPNELFRVSPAQCRTGRDLLDWGRALPNPPTAYITYSDYIAAEFIGHAIDLGLRVPDDVSVIGCDGDPIGMLLRPTLTTIAQPRREQGKAAGEILLKLIEGEKCENKIFHPQLIARNSVSFYKNTTDKTNCQSP